MQASRTNHKLRFLAIVTEDIITCVLVAITKLYLNVDKRLTLCNVQHYLSPSTPPPRTAPTSSFTLLATYKRLIRRNEETK